ncbi:hypothetical protein J4Q44_G00186960 [Coregonus suidteri]|uniref:Uncharacterized protein n=1 Tax=Coregonus suidteri TaxID=861788 RepID=A0AAN8QTJ8_9TELE
MKMREYLCNVHGFVDIETPTLFKRTPGVAFTWWLALPGTFNWPGAKDMKVPNQTDRQNSPRWTLKCNLWIKLESEGLVQYSWPVEKGPVSTPFTCMMYEGLWSGHARHTICHEIEFLKEALNQPEVCFQEIFSPGWSSKYS